jgi:hypothetical protein
MGGELLKEYYQVFWSASNIDDVRMFIIKWMNFENSCELIGAHMPENTMEVKENHWNYVRMLSYFSLYRKFPDDWYKTSEAIAALKKIDITIFHGRCDLLCPLSGVYDLFKNHPHMKLKVYDHVGHGVDTDGHMTEDLMIALNEIVE